MAEQQEAQTEQRTPLGAYVSTETVERLREAAQEQDRSVSALVRRALSEYLEREAQAVLGS